MAELTSNEQRIPREDRSLGTILDVVTDGILGMARRVKRLDGDVAQLPGGVVGGSVGDLVTILTADDGDVKGL